MYSGEENYNKWNYYKCISAEIEYDGRLFILDNGHWTKVAKNYKDEIDSFYDQMPISNLKLPGYHEKETEDSYNKRIEKSNKNFILMDKKNIPTGQSRSVFEFCDIYTKDRCMIHVKRYGSSSVISHLFNQGLTSGTLITDQNIRKEVNKKLKSDWLLPENDTFSARDYEITFVIISKKNVERPMIPFFSKVILMNNVKALKGYGYHVSFINVSEE